MSGQRETGQQVACSLDRAPCKADRPVQVVETLVAMALEMPEPSQSRGEPPTALRIGRGQAPVERDAQIVILGVELRPPRIQIFFAARLHVFGEMQKVVEVTIAGGDHIVGLDEAIRGVVPDGLQQAVARLALPDV